MNLQINDTVKVNWTWCGHTYVAIAKVIKINQKSIRCELLEDVATVCGEDGWPVGFSIRVDLEDVIKVS